MKRRPARRPSQVPTAPHAQPANRCRAIVPVDGTRIRKKIKQDYEKALRDLEHSRRQLEQFHEADVPQFTRWLHAHFGALLTELRELGQQLAADEELVFQVRDEMLFGRCSAARAYQRVMELRENPEPLPPVGDDTDDDRDPFGARPKSGDADRDEDPVASFFDHLFDEFGPDERPPDRRGQRVGHRAESATRAAGASRLKEIYRALVRRLHPDTQREMTAQKTEWWHQTQAAYEAGDVEQLEVILTLCEIGDSGTTAHTSASLLQRITANLKSSLRQLKRELADRRRDPAWAFSRHTDHDVLALRMRHDLTGDLQAMRAQWRQTQGLITEWKAAAERLQQPRRRKGKRGGY